MLLGVQLLSSLKKSIMQRRKHTMQIKLLLQSIPARNLPLILTNQQPSTIIKQTTAITVNRSPHIDKRAREQFKIFTKRNIITKKITILQYTKIQQLIQTLKNQYLLMRITVYLTITEHFKSNF